MRIPTGFYRVMVPAIFATSAAAAETRGQLQIEAPPGLCEPLRINASAHPRNAQGTFSPYTLGKEPVSVVCNSTVWVTSPGTGNDTVELRFDAQGQTRFSGAHAALNTTLNAPFELSLRVLYPLLAGEQKVLDAERQRLFAKDRARLDELTKFGLPADLQTREQVRTALNHAQVRVMLPFFRWRESRQEQIAPDPELPALIAALPLNDPRWWDLPEFTGFTDAWLHATARSLLATRAELARGDQRWLRARLLAIAESFDDPALQQRLRDASVLKHLDEDGSGGMDAVLAKWRRTAGSEAQKQVDAALAAESDANDHPRFVYQNLSDTELRIHLLKPFEAATTPMPAVLWFHGGSATRGAWWHMPVVAKVLREQGVAVLSVELSTQNRFDSDADQLRDADAAWQWLENNADSLQLDRTRLGVAGFSSGATLALTGATRGFDEGADPRALPAMAIVMGACADPLAKEEDGWFRKAMEGRGDPARLTPMGNIRSGLPPVLAIHGTEDEYCSFETLSRFADKSRALGNRVEIATISGASHFFVFHHRPGIESAREAITAHLQHIQWLPVQKQ